MADKTRLRPEPAGRRPDVDLPSTLSRFDVAERIVHWVNATLFAVVMVTAAALYVPFISAYVGRRELVKSVHVYTGLLLPFPVVLGVVGRRWGRRLRSDLRRLNRWSPEDARWLKRGGWRRGRGDDIALGKFNPGQKLNAAFTGGAILVMLATGSMMRWYKPWPLRWRTGATFVHDWIALALFCTITGHVWFAINDRDSLRAMWEGTISRRWAHRRAPRWLEEVDGKTAAPPEPESGPEASSDQALRGS
jgi:formate dehydrogenase subunit gamma